MKFFKKDNIKEITIIAIVVLLFMCICSYVLNYIQYQEYKQAINQKIQIMIEMVLKQNPEADAYVLQALREGDKIDTSIAKEFLEKYGYTNENISYFSDIEEQFQRNTWLNMLLIGTLGILFFLIFVTYFMLRDRRIDEITNYLKKLQKRDYSLKIEDNTEGELSELRNEIYKMAVMLQEETEELSKEKKILADSLSDISHQLKTPLTSISVMIDVLEENTDMPIEKRKEFLHEIARQLEWIKWLVITLLKLSKLDAGTAELKQEKIEVKELINTVIQNLSIPIEIKNQKVVVTGEEQASFIGDFNWTQEAILNIVKNCLEHTVEGREINIHYLENPLYTEITIQDNGSGIAKEDLPNIFKRFYKGKNSSKDSVGIGLALAKSIIEKQGGDITVQSKEGVGSTFRIQIFKGAI